MGEDAGAQRNDGFPPGQIARRRRWGSSFAWVAPEDRSVNCWITVPGTGQHKPALVGSTASAVCCVVSPTLVPGSRLQPPLPACAALRIPLPASSALSSKRARQWHAGTQASAAPTMASEAGSAFQSYLGSCTSQEVCPRDSPRHRQVFKRRTVKDALKMQSETVDVVSLFQSPLLFSASRDGRAGGAVAFRDTKTPLAPYVVQENSVDYGEA